MLSLPYIQIIVDILFFIAIFFLLHQLNKKIKQRSPMIDASAVSELRKLIGNSESITNQFTTSMEDGKQQINKLIKQLDDKERKLVMLIEEAETTLQKLSVQKTEPEPDIKCNQYDEVIKMARQGLSLEEIAKRSGVTEGEITLVVELAKNREI